MLIKMTTSDGKLITMIAMMIYLSSTKTTRAFWPPERSLMGMQWAWPRGMNICSCMLYS